MYQALTNSLYAGASSTELTLSDTTPSTSTDSGTLVVAGGAGIGGDVFVGGDLTVTGTNISTGISSTTTNVDTSAATAPTTGQVLTATSGTTATWQTPSGGGGYGGIGWGTYLYYDGIGTVSSGATRPHTELFFFKENGASSTVLFKGANAPAGTYTNRTGSTLSAAQVGYFERTA